MVLQLFAHALIMCSFLRGMPDLTRMMKRVEANLGKLVSNVKAEPDFYEVCHSFKLLTSSLACTEFQPTFALLICFSFADGSEAALAPNTTFTSL